MFLQDLHPFAPLESSYGKSLEKPTQKTRRKLKCENNENANKKENDVVLDGITITRTNNTHDAAQ